MKLKFFGTAAAEGFPALFCDCDSCHRARKAGGKNLRRRSQAVVDDKILIDFGPDTLSCALYDGLPLMHLHTCLITHSHEDHLSTGLTDALLASCKTAPDEPPLDFYMTPASAADERIGFVRTLEERGLIAQNRCRYIPVEPFVPFEVEDGYRITALPADHDSRCDPVFYSIEKDGKALLYAHDTGCFNESVWQYLAQNGAFQLVSLDCTDMSDTRPRNGHMSLLTCSEVHRRMLDIGAADAQTRFVLNHFSHNATPLYEEALAVAQENGFELSFDGMEIIF